MLVCLSLPRAARTAAIAAIAAVLAIDIVLLTIGKPGGAAGARDIRFSARRRTSSCSSPRSGW